MNDELFYQELKDFLGEGAIIPLFKINRGDKINIPKTLSLICFENFPNKEKWLDWYFNNKDKENE